jgi:hypothetical protein
MPWRNAQSVPFSRIDIVTQVPSASGVFGLMTGDSYLLIADSWNMKARLLDLINSIPFPAELTVLFELCPEHGAEARRNELAAEYTPPAHPAPAFPPDRPSGISFWNASDNPVLTPGDGREI